MFKRVLALTLAAIMLLMPMTASAVTWDTIMTSLRTSNAYKDGSTTATVNGDTITVSGGDVQDIVINESGKKYVFKGVSIQGSTLELRAADNELIDLTLDKDTKFDTSYWGLNVFFSGGNSEARIHNDTTIVGPWKSFFIDFVGEGNKVTVDGDGTIHYSTNDDSKFNRSPVKVQVYEGSQMDIDSVKKAVLMQQNIALTEGMPLMVLETYKQASDAPKITGKYFVDLNGALYRINDDGTQTLIDPDFILLEEDEEEEPEPEPDPVEEQRQAEAIGGVTTSPVWNWQGYLGHSSKPMWIYVNGEKVLMRQRLFWLGDSTKNHTCRINVAEPDPASIELRVGLDMLRTAQRAEISVISILDKDSNPIAQFAVSDLLGAFEQYGLEEGELLCVSADPDAEVMKVTLDGEYLPLEEAEEENAAA